MNSSSRTMGELFETFEREAFRLETLSDYSRSGSVAAYQEFLAGRQQPDDYNADWVTEVRHHTSSGKRVYRVHILSRPLSPYLRFELGWGYRRNMSGGEEFFILDTTDRPNPLPEAPDFWLFDSAAAAVLSYDEAGSFLGSEVLEPERTRDFVVYRDIALAEAEPFTDWWATYGE
ncbi:MULTISPECIES: DUF6879 family protein [unclassified Streptomyces]|uniref:DUF6879 family protein n=1 Tax=unclassified Streptomyces TaxID=2593676 RepID=UPI00342ED96D